MDTPVRASVEESAAASRVSLEQLDEEAVAQITDDAMFQVLHRLKVQIAIRKADVAALQAVGGMLEFFREYPERVELDVADRVYRLVGILADRLAEPWDHVN